MAIPIINTTETVDQVAFSFVEQVPFFFPAMLLFLGAIIVIAGFLFQERKSGEGSIKAWLAIATFIVATLAIILYLVPGGLIDGVSVTVAIGLSIVTALVYLLS